MHRSKRNIPIKDRFRVNNRIRAREVRLIAEDGGQVGIIPIHEALALAEEQNLDLVEVAPNATPPVCRLMDYGKFRYEQSKKEREARKHQKQVELKEVRLRPKTDTHDLDVKANQARRFLRAGDKVKFTVRFRGREMAHTNIGRDMLDHLVESLRDVAVVEQKPTLESRALSLVLAPSAKPGKSSKPRTGDQPRVASDEKKKVATPPVSDEDMDIDVNVVELDDLESDDDSDDMIDDDDDEVYDDDDDDDEDDDDDDDDEDDDDDDDDDDDEEEDEEEE